MQASPFNSTRRLACCTDIVEAQSALVAAHYLQWTAYSQVLNCKTQIGLQAEQGLTVLSLWQGSLVELKNFSQFES